MMMQLALPDVDEDQIASDDMARYLAEIHASPEWIRRQELFAEIDRHLAESNAFAERHVSAASVVRVNSDEDGCPDCSSESIPTFNEIGQLECLGCGLVFVPGAA